MRLGYALELVAALAVGMALARAVPDDHQGPQFLRYHYILGRFLSGVALYAD